jgi:phage shock protein C
MSPEPTPRKLTKNLEHRQLSGVCAGFADYFNVDRNLVRVIAILLLVLTGGTAFIAYILAAFFLPIREQDRGLAKKSWLLTAVFGLLAIGALLAILMP